jgi:hypothetical protein
MLLFDSNWQNYGDCRAADHLGCKLIAHRVFKSAAQALGGAHGTEGLVIWRRAALGADDAIKIAKDIHQSSADPIYPFAESDHYTGEVLRAGSNKDNMVTNTFLGTFHLYVDFFDRGTPEERVRPKMLTYRVYIRTKVVRGVEVLDASIPQQAILIPDHASMVWTKRHTA